MAPAWRLWPCDLSMKSPLSRRDNTEDPNGSDLSGSLLPPPYAERGAKEGWAVDAIMGVSNESLSSRQRTEVGEVLRWGGGGNI